MHLVRFENKDLEISKENQKIFNNDLKDQVLILEDEKVVFEIDNKKPLATSIKGKELATNIQEKLESELNKAKTDIFQLNVRRIKCFKKI